MKHGFILAVRNDTFESDLLTISTSGQLLEIFHIEIFIIHTEHCIFVACHRSLFCICNYIMHYSLNVSLFRLCLRQRN